MSAPLPLRKDEAAPLWVRDLAAIFRCGVDPETDRVLRVAQGDFVRFTVRHTSGQLRYIGDERLIFVTPEDDDFVPIRHVSSPPDDTAKSMIVPAAPDMA
jgi:hypothetical protein